MKLKIKLAPGAQVAFTSTGHRFLADDGGNVEVEENSQDHYDLLKQGGVVEVAVDPEDAKQDDGPADEAPAKKAAAKRKAA